MDTLQANSLSNQALPAQGLYPTAPLSWLTPLWAYACGVAASSAFSWRGGNLLLFPLGLLLVGPLLGTAWRASGQIQFYRQQAENAPSQPLPKPIVSVPYTLSGSASEHLASWLGAVSARLQRVAPQLGTPLVQLAGTTVFALAMAAQLGQRTLVLAVASLVCACARGRSRGRWAGNAVISNSLPIFLNWLIGHAVYASLRPGSALVAACFAITFYGCSQVNRTGKGLLRQLLPQVVAITYLIVVRQPLAAAAIALLASSQLLWAPLLQTSEGRTAYFRAVRLPLAMSMLLSAWTLGCTP